MHYPFVAPGGKPSSITFSCLVSCDNAARACSTISSVYSQRTPMFLAPVLLVCVSIVPRVFALLREYNDSIPPSLPL